MVVSNNDGFRVFLCNTNTGKITTDIPVSSLKWGLRLNAWGFVSASLRPHSEEARGIPGLRTAHTPVKQSLGVAYGGRVLECGPIWGRSVSGGAVNLEADGIGSLFDHRKAVAGAMLLPGAKVTQSKLTLTGSLADIARQLVRISLHDNPYVDGPLNNIIVPDVYEGGPHVRVYHGYELAWIGDRLRELSGVEGGPDIRFKPRFSGSDPTVVEWVMECGTPEQPWLKQAGADWVWDSGVEGGLEDLDVSENASGLGALAWAPGSGQEREMRLAVGHNLQLLDEGYPWLEVDDAAKDVEDLGVLESHARRQVADASASWDTVTLKVRADSEPTLGTCNPGDYARIVVPEDHPTLDPGAQRVRVMAVDGGAGLTVSLSVAQFQDLDPVTIGVGETIVDSDSDGHMVGSWAAAPLGTWAAMPPGTWKEV